MSTEKLALTIKAAAMRKRVFAAALWEEADKDMAKASELLEEAKKNADKNADRSDGKEV